MAEEGATLSIEAAEFQRLQVRSEEGETRQGVGVVRVPHHYLLRARGNVAPAFCPSAPLSQTQLIELRTANYQLKEQQAKLTNGTDTHARAVRCIALALREMSRDVKLAC